ncbi:N-lysine methyltransferase KMT5A-like [Branchiostoma floridae]|uniref:[histone H4]-lysine(20) N-methyltransferase n=2 Tax=Branchiostoma floridae TaxID=7739 RepID=A0A9J7N6D2_BRAFL|nr:N-lysine methyltransferase KMT5A-like [Branchiostoma floridae]
MARGRSKKNKHVKGAASPQVCKTKETEPTMQGEEKAGTQVVITDFFPKSPENKTLSSSPHRIAKELIDIAKATEDVVVTRRPGAEAEVSQLISTGLVTPETTPTKTKAKPGKVLMSQLKPKSLESGLGDTTTAEPGVREALAAVSDQQDQTPDTKETSAATSAKGRGRKNGKKAPSTSVSRPSSARKRRDRKPVKSHHIDDYFVRRSARKSQAELKQEKEEWIEQQILANAEEGMEVVDIEGKGRGVVATKAFGRGDFVVEYAGDLIDTKMAKDREAKYAEDPSTGCYMYYFKYRNKTYCVDATAESGRLGRLINHSAKHKNLMTRSISAGGLPRLILVAARDIQPGEELQYDYGDRSKASLESHPWLAC